MSERYNLPADTAVLVNDHIARCKNLSLILDKYPPDRVVADTKHKGPWLLDLIQGNHLDAALAEAVYKRWQAMIVALGATSFDAALDWRMVMGLGGESVLETALTLHRLYGLPFIPASALKGLTRAYLTGEIEGYKSEKIDDDNAAVQRIFGSQEHAGTVLFFDALPTSGKVAFALDIMNPHYPDYYGGGKKPPTNDQNPIPVTFLTVANTTFTFALAPRDASQQQHLKDVENARGWLLKALQTYGVGGKTSAGYGYFTNFQQSEASATTSAQPLAEAQKPPSIPYIRPNIPRFAPGQGIPGAVVASTDELRQRIPEAKAFLRFREFPTKDVIIVVNAEEATTWTPGQTRMCLFESEEECNGCTVLVCRPGVKKDKKK